MSRRYECGNAREIEAGVMACEEALEEEVLYDSETQAGHIALIIGDPYATAYALTGTPAEVLAYLDRARAQVARAQGAAHAMCPQCGSTEARPEDHPYPCGDDGAPGLAPAPRSVYN